MAAVLEDLFANLARPASASNELCARPIPGIRRHRIAKDSAGLPCFLIAVNGPPPVRPPIALSNLSVHHGVVCSIRDMGGRVTDGAFTVVRFCGRDAALATFFLRAVGDVVRTLGNDCTPDDVTSVVTQLVALFSALSKPPQKTVQGFWAELLLIARATRPEALLNAWHATPEDRYDFNAGEERLEVKSSGNRERLHHFSLEQLQPPAGVTLLVVSMFVERSASGCSVRDLLERIRGRVADDMELVNRLDIVAAESLGRDFTASLDTAFDEAMACESLAYYRHDVIPCIAAPLPDGVANVKFVSDLGKCEPCAVGSLRKGRGLLAASVPRSEGDRRRVGARRAVHG